MNSEDREKERSSAVPVTPQSEQETDSGLPPSEDSMELPPVLPKTNEEPEAEQLKSERQNKLRFHVPSTDLLGKRKELAGQQDPADAASIKENRTDKGTPSEKRADGRDLKEKAMSLLTNWKVSAGAIGLAVLMTLTAMSMGSSVGSKDGMIRDLKEQVADLESDMEDREGKIAAQEKEIDELKNGPDRMLEIVQARSNDKDWSGVVESADQLHEKYPGTQADQNGQELKKGAQAEIEKAEEAKRLEEEKKKQEEEKKKQEEAARKAEEERQKAEKEAQGYETGITYDQLARYPDQYIGEKVKFSGKVIQVMNSGDEYKIRLAVDSNYDTVILGTFNKSVMTSGKVLEDDIITVYGVSGGDYTYETVMGGELTVPLVFIDKMDQ